MRPYTPKEKARIIAGTVTAVIIVGMMAVVALAFLWIPPS
jgi:hypothetical protein